MYSPQLLRLKHDSCREYKLDGWTLIWLEFGLLYNKSYLGQLWPIVYLVPEWFNQLQGTAVMILIF